MCVNNRMSLYFLTVCDLIFAAYPYEKYTTSHAPGQPVITNIINRQLYIDPASASVCVCI